MAHEVIFRDLPHQAAQFYQLAICAQSWASFIPASLSLKKVPVYTEVYLKFIAVIHNRKTWLITFSLWSLSQLMKSSACCPRVILASSADT